MAKNAGHTNLHSITKRWEIFTYVLRLSRDPLGFLTSFTGGRTFVVVRCTAGRSLEAIARQAPCQAAEWPILKASRTFFAIARQGFATCNHLIQEASSSAVATAKFT